MCCWLVGGLRASRWRERSYIRSCKYTKSQLPYATSQFMIYALISIPKCIISLRDWELSWLAVGNVHLTGILKVVPLLACAMCASKSFSP